MNDFFNDMNSIYWWVSVVIVGILINIIAALILKYGGFFLNKISKIYRINNNKQKEKELKLIDKVSKSKEDQILYHLEIIHQKNWIIICYIIGSLSFILGSIIINEYNQIILGIGAIILISGVIMSFRSVRDYSILLKAKENNSFNNNSI